MKKVKGKGNKNSSIKYIFDIEKCKQCKYKEGCYKENAKIKSYSIRILSEVHKNSIEFQETEEYKINEKNDIKLKPKIPN